MSDERSVFKETLNLNDWPKDYQIKTYTSTGLSQTAAGVWLRGGLLDALQGLEGTLQGDECFLFKVEMNWSFVRIPYTATLLSGGNLTDIWQGHWGLRQVVNEIVSADTSPTRPTTVPNLENTDAFWYSLLPRTNVETIVDQKCYPSVPDPIVITNINQQPAQPGLAAVAQAVWTQQQIFTFDKLLEKWGTGTGPVLSTRVDDWYLSQQAGQLGWSIVIYYSDYT